MNIIISKATKQLLVPYRGALRELFPNAKTIPHNGYDLAIIPHHPRTQVQLRAAGIEVPPPILTHYDWERQTPFETQKTTAALLTSNRRAFVLSDMGTGKTRAALWAWRYLFKTSCANKLLIVCPLSTMRFTWQAEISRIMPDVKVIVLHGSKEHRLKLLKQDFDVAIINHDGLARVVGKELAARTDIDTLILDELAVYRNQSIRSKHMRVFAKRFVWAWGLTGRPMPQAPTDCWAQCQILAPQRVPQFFRHAQSMLMTQVNAFLWVPRPNALDIAYSWMQPAVRFSLDDVVELPEFISRTVDVELTPRQAQVYREMSNYLAVLVEEKKVTAANAAVCLGKLLQIASGCVYTENPQYVVLDSEPRQQMLIELIEEASEKVIVFAPFKHLIEETSKLLTHHKIEHAVITGETTRREKILDAFQNSSAYHVLLAHPQTLHHGVTLTSASTAIWLSPPTSLEIFEQAEARIRRYGQKNKQQYFYLQSTSVERRIYAGLKAKKRIQDDFLDMVRTATNAI